MSGDATKKCYRGLLREKSLKMNQFLLTALVLILTCRAGSSQDTSVRDLEAFTSIRVFGPADVKLVKGADHSVKIQSTGFSSSDVKTVVTGNSLRINIGSTGMRNRADVKIVVTYRELNSIHCSGACNIFSSEPIKSKEMEINATSASVIETEVQCQKLMIDCSTAGQVIVSGYSDELHVDAATSGLVDANVLKTARAVVNARTAAGVKIQVSETLQAEVSTAASLRYRGNPSKTNLQSFTGGGIRKAD